jgi:hypothetical protein
LLFLEECVVFIGEVDEMLEVAWKYVLEGFQMPACFNSVAIMDMRSERGVLFENGNVDGEENNVEFVFLEQTVRNDIR